jgi:CysZ protein
MTGIDELLLRSGIDELLLRSGIDELLLRSEPVRFVVGVTNVMGLNRGLPILLPIGRAIGQLDDPAFRGVLLWSLAWSLACVIGLHVGTIWAVHRLLAPSGWFAWAVDFLGSVGASLLAFWLFLPIAVGIGTLYIGRIAAAVEQRFYPWLPHPQGASMWEQTWDGIAVALKVLVLNVVALVLAVMVPGLGLLLAWIIAAYAIGRGLFVAVAMRRMNRIDAERLYRRGRTSVLASGAMLSISAYIPVLNLLIPIIGTACMVHILDLTLTASEADRSLVRHRMNVDK